MKEQFERDGFSIVEGIIESQECGDLIKQLNRLAKNRSRAGIRNLMAVPQVAMLAHDRRLIELTEKIFGQEMTPFKATLFEKSGKANWLVAWHQDTAIPVEKSITGNGWGPASIKEGITFVHAPESVLSKIIAIRIHLDASTDINGPLRVIPGSHKLRHSDDELGRISATRNQEICTVGKGGVIAMSPLLVHASSKCNTDVPRRVLHIEYAASLVIARDVNLAIA
ncbi:phytanoyl-CoA dioxygenase family protein [Leptolyngbya sp. 7M]|uniref:phytanoyl-CoA dioxygenase family protein n=1 Tax=Leptolyngbya sp. 7M TaxID=2812896 RepID=UPI001B8B93B1|nr:phytanoyl-CoA dioxygenase family protein [Leptolyngbya sp. 7M]QYO67600.1 phytanoyl-CoA dioxygenase family protein [Leptolyngbya sp. 7M]